jgi:CRISPR type III-A-associated RAMP protein Csm5
MNNKQFETARLCLHVITPINIADGITLGDKDYLYDAKTQKAYFLNLQLWHKFIYSHGLLPSYEAFLQRNGKILLEWLRENGYDIADVQSCIIAEVQAKVDLRAEEQRQRGSWRNGGAQTRGNVRNNSSKKKLNDVNRHIQQPDGSLYIPGSSIKGAFRTAILYALLQKRPDIKNRYWRQVLFLLNKPKLNIKKEFGNLTNAMEAELLHTLQLPDKNGYVKSNNAVCSAMRGLQVSDTFVGKNVQAGILQKLDVGFERIEGEPLPTYRECILPGADLVFDVKIDKAYMQTIGMASIDALLVALFNFNTAVMDLLENAFKKHYPKAFINVGGANMFVGAGTGFLSKTLLAMLAPNKEEAKNVIRELLDKSFKQHKHMQYDKVISPRTLKCTSYNGQIMLMGLAEVRRQ